MLPTLDILCRKTFYPRINLHSDPFRWKHAGHCRRCFTCLLFMNLGWKSFCCVIEEMPVDAMCAEHVRYQCILVEFACSSNVGWFHYTIEVKIESLQPQLSLCSISHSPSCHVLDRIVSEMWASWWEWVNLTLDSPSDPCWILVHGRLANGSNRWILIDSDLCT